MPEPRALLHRSPRHSAAGIAAAGIAAASVCLASPRAMATEFLFTLDTAASSSSFEQSFSTPLTGTLIGDYDAKQNPGGTQTRLGLFGGSGNMPIPFNGTIAISGGTESAPQGTFLIDWSEGAPTATMRELFLDLLGDAEAAVALSFTINYSTFRTINPTGFFPGGFPIEIPLGEAALTVLEVRQTEPASLVVIPTKTGFAVEGAIPVETFAIATQNEQVFEIGPTPGVLPFNSIVIETPTGYRMVATSQTSGEFSETFEQDLPPTPLPLPTLGGDTANLILNGALSGASGTSTVDLSLVADGATAGPIGDLNGDGVVNGADLGILLNAWGQSGVPADLDGNGLVDGGDLALLLTNWSSS